VKIALSCHAPERRRTMLEEATGHFGRALQLLELQEARDGDDGEDADAIERDLTRGEVAYWLGRARFDLDQYEEAVTALQLAVLMRYQTPLARLRLGVAYVRLGHFCEGESEFEEILQRNGRPSGDDDRPMVGPPGDELSWREIEVWASIYKAGARIERDAGVNEAIADIENLAERIENLPEGKRVSARAACEDWKGWGWFRLNEVDRAIQYVTRSVDLEPTGEGYLHLALVHAHRVVYGRQAEQRRREEERARYYAELAGRMGLGAQQRTPLDDMLRRLDSEKERRVTTAKAQARKSEAGPVG
jgi:tetratricopeptide (TPR) repeat protein